MVIADNGVAGKSAGTVKRRPWSRSLLAQMVAGSMLFAGARSHAAPDTGVPQKSPPFNMSLATDVATFPHHWPREQQAPAHAPNVLLIMTDDVGFAASSTFGGPIPTPTLTWLAKHGLRYNDFNTTAMCSPSRASLLTGRNPHHVNMSNVENLPSSFDGYTTVIPKSAATIAKILEENGYSTAAFGKWHLTPEWEQSEAGPFDHWPTGMGFQYFYGFLNADTDQWAPTLVENTTPVQPPRGDPHYILDRDLAAHAIRWIHEERALTPDRPFFIYYATGSTHAPQQAPKSWIAKFKGKFDEGWDRQREETFARQKALGIIPEIAKLTPRPPELPAWESLSPDQKRLAERYMEVYAAQLAFGDAQIGRVIDALRQGGELANTLVIFIEGDNGPSAEGGPHGLLFEQSPFNHNQETLRYALSRIDDIGGPTTYNIYPAGWAWAMATPFKWFKQIASHFGGTRNGMVVSWPGHTQDDDKMRSQFCYIADITPTILDAIGIPAPQSVDGVTQMPFDGKSLTYTFDEPNSASRRHTQYFEIMQNIGIYHDGWVAATDPIQMPWNMLKGAARTVSLDERKWELYHVATDFSEADNLAAQDPEKLRQLQKLFLVQARLNNVLPIHSPTVGTEGRPSLGGGRTSFTYYPGTSGVFWDAAPHFVGKSFEITADVDVPDARTNGVLMAQGGRFGGYSFYLDNGHLTFCDNAVPPRIYTVRSAETISPGHHVLSMSFKIDDAKPGAGGWVTLTIEGRAVAREHVEHTLSLMPWTEGLDVGRDLLTPVSADYSVPDRFSGRIRTVTVRLE
jgi:arylsulfatase A-like enzyme